MKWNGMGLRALKIVLVSGLSLIALIGAGCGGGSSTTSAGQGPGVVTEGTTNCAAVANPETLAASFDAVLGSCHQYVASTFPTKSATTFRSPGISQPVIYRPNLGYDISLPLLAINRVSIPLGSTLRLPGGVAAYSFGNFAGNSYQTILDANTGGAALVHDFRSTTTLATQKYLDLNHSRFGLFSRFDNRTLGYFGGWTQGETQGNLPATLVSFRGAVIGVLGPSTSNTSAQTSVSFSADVTLQVNFAATGAPVTVLTFSNFGYSANEVLLPAQIVAPGGAVSTSSLDSGSKSLSALFTTNPSGASTAIVEGQLGGSFYGKAGSDVSEFVGTIKFRTADGRNAIGALGVRSGAQITNPL
jgi:hypothetical protein